MEARPIVLRLLPGEETIFNLKVVNHGDPSNLTLQVSDPVFKAVRPRKPDHYVVVEESIPIIARMPSNRDRLDGEIMLKGSAGVSRVPITLLRDSEDPGDDLEDPGPQMDEDLRDDIHGESLDHRDEDPDDDREDGEADEDPDEDLDDFDRTIRRRIRDYDEDEQEPRRIVFSKERDLQRYRSARQTRNEGSNGSRGSLENVADDADSVYERSGEPGSSKDAAARQTLRAPGNGYVDDGVPSASGLRTPGDAVPGVDRTPVSSLSATQPYQDTYRNTMQGQGVEAGGHEPDLPEDDPAPDTGELEEDYSNRKGLIGNLGWGSVQVIPAAIFLGLILVLVMTFITESIPEFPGALGSSILIVTLIIYGAATLLKA